MHDCYEGFHIEEIGEIQKTVFFHDLKFEKVWVMI